MYVYIYIYIYIYIYMYSLLLWRITGHEKGNRKRGSDHEIA